jgi:predicted TIM-barrel fold metal-dependent hydrolase
MYTYPNVYADLSTITWIIPRKTFHAYLKGLIENGLEKRLMFGSDAMQWPEAIELAIESVEAADFLTEGQKRDIFYNNAARFFRLSDEEIKQHHGN